MLTVTYLHLHNPGFLLLQVMLRTEGVKGFYRGAWTNTVRCLPGASIQFGAYELMKTFLGC